MKNKLIYLLIMVIFVYCSPKSKPLPLNIFSVANTEVSNNTSELENENRKPKNKALQVIEKTFNYSYNGLIIDVIYLEKKFSSTAIALKAYLKDIPNRPLYKEEKNQVHFARNQYAGWILSENTLAYSMVIHPKKSWYTLSKSTLKIYSQVIDNYMKEWLLVQ